MNYPIRFRRAVAALIVLLALSGCVRDEAAPAETTTVPTTCPTAVTDTAPTCAATETVPNSPTETTVSPTTPTSTVPIETTAPPPPATIPPSTAPTVPETVPTTVPVTSIPETTVPETTVPETTVPETTESAPTLHTVTFLDHDGTVLTVRQVCPGQSAPLPPDPVRSGYVFAGWNGSYQSITADTTVTAAYVSAGAPNLFTAESRVDADTVTVTIRLQGTILTCGLECRLDYDENVLQYVDMTKHNNVEANHIAPNADSQIILVWAGSDNMTAATIRSGGTLLELRFRVTDPDATDTVLTFLKDSIYVDVVDENGNYSAGEFTLTKGVVHLK